MSHEGLSHHTVFVDTSGLGAYVIKRDAFNASAHIIQDRLQRERWLLATTNFVLAELHAFILRRADQTLALRVIQEIRGSTTRIERVSEPDEARALDILTRYTDNDFSFTDATSFAVMERLGIGTAFTFDHHFGQYGFQALTADPA